MNFRVIVFLLTILMVVPLHARTKTDVIVMKNGDKITCEIKGLSSDTLFISVDYILSTLSVDWNKVDHIESNQLFLVKTENGTVYTGTLSETAAQAGRPLEIEIADPATPETKVTLTSEQIARMDQTSSSFRERWNGQLGS